MNLKIYTTSDCPACVRVQEFVEANSVECEVVMVQDPGKTKLVNLPLVYPALYEESKLLAYGDDIITSLLKRGHGHK